MLGAVASSSFDTDPLLISVTKKDLGIVKQIIHDSIPLQVIQNGNSHKRSFQSLHISRESTERLKI